MRFTKLFFVALIPTAAFCLLLVLSSDSIRAVFVPQTEAVTVNLGTVYRILCQCGDGGIEPPPVGTAVRACTQPQCGCTPGTNPETCDDGNTTDGDGCSSACKLEPGWTCTTGPASNKDWAKIGYVQTFCTKCGNAKVEKGEECDFGASNGTGNGCSASCHVETGWTCASGKCQKCSNGIVESGEKCDDGNMTSGDGCSPTCSTETGYTCSGTPSTCKKCGDGILQTGEKCDDGNSQSWDGCSKYCAIESGWTCTAVKGEESVCSKLCGNGVRNIGELCDLGSNNGTGEGCTTQCKNQAGWSCAGNPTVCTNKKTKQKTYPVVPAPFSSSNSSRSSSAQSAISSARSSSSSSLNAACPGGFGPVYTVRPTCPAGTVLRSVPSWLTPGVTCYDCPPFGYNF